MKFTFAPESRPLDGYTIKRAIHRGGFGEVYYALSDAGKEVALKLLNNNLEVELRGVRQCLNLKHTNLVTIFDIREDGDNDHWVVPRSRRPPLSPPLTTARARARGRPSSMWTGCSRRVASRPVAWC